MVVAITHLQECGDIELAAFCEDRVVWLTEHHRLSVLLHDLLRFLLKYERIRRWPGRLLQSPEFGVSLLFLALQVSRLSPTRRFADLSVRLAFLLRSPFGLL